MKLLHLNEFYAVVGGLEQYLLALCDICDAEGHATAFVYSAATGREPKDTCRPAYHIPGIAGPTPTSRQALDRLEDVLAREAPDIIVIHEIHEPQVVALATRSRPTIRFGHGVKIVCPGGRRMWNRSHQICGRPVGLACQAVAYRERCLPRNPCDGLQAISRTRRLLALYREHSDLVVPSAFMRELLLREEVRKDRVHVIPYFTRIPDRQSSEIPAIPRRIFCAARLTPEKGVQHLLRALAGLPPPAHLLVAGDGPAREGLQTLARELGLIERVTFGGWFSHEAIATALAEAQIVVFPSLAPESFGIVGIEAMVRGRPVVAYDAGGVREWLIPDATGLLVPLGDLPGLSRAIRSLLDDPGRGVAMGKAARAVAEERFSPERHVRDFLAVAGGAFARWA